VITTKGKGDDVVTAYPRENIFHINDLSPVITGVEPLKSLQEFLGVGAVSAGAP
jgi:hypothetical protein